MKLVRSVYSTSREPQRRASGSESDRFRSRGGWLILLLLSGHLIFCHGCHGEDVDDELCVPPPLREIRDPKEVSNSNTRNINLLAGCLSFWIPSFEFLSDFGFRVSDFLSGHFHRQRLGEEIESSFPGFCLERHFAELLLRTQKCGIVGAIEFANRDDAVDARMQDIALVAEFFEHVAYLLGHPRGIVETLARVMIVKAQFFQKTAGR